MTANNDSEGVRPEEEFDFEEPTQPLDEIELEPENQPKEAAKEEPVFEVKQKYSNVENRWNEDDMIIDLPSATLDQTKKNLTSLPSEDIDAGEKWANSLAQSVQKHANEPLFKESLARENSDWKQSVEHSGRDMGIAELKTKKPENSILKGARARLEFSKHLGVWSIISVPLWHSGIWVNLKTPSEIEILELYRYFTNTKVKVGRDTSGFGFENGMSFTIDRLMTFIKDHIHSTTVKLDDTNEEVDISSIVLSQDIPTLVWGIACAQYPRGFQYRRACLTDPSKCYDVIEERINLTKLQWVDNKALSEANRNFMADKQPKIRTVESIKQYQSQILNLSKRTFTIVTTNDKEFNITVKSPTISEYISSGYKWISNLENEVDKVLSSDSSDKSSSQSEGTSQAKEKNTLISRYAQATAMRQYSHWVDKIEFDDNSVEDSESIEEIMDILSQDIKASLEIIEQVNKYINHTTISMIGIPTYECAKCGEMQEGNDKARPAFANVIPLDPITVFFDLLVSRTRLITSR